MKDTEPTNSQKRRHRREDVQLDVLVELGGHHVWPTKTVNVSEGGVALLGSAGMDCSPGTTVNVNPKGILSDNCDPGHTDYSMRVVHTSNEETGLQFL